MKQFVFNYYELPEEDLLVELEDQKIKILAFAKEQEHQSNAQYIQKVLDARKFSVPDNEILILERKKAIPFRSWGQKLPNLKLIISFGWSKRELQLQINNPMHQTFSIGDCHLIMAPSVSDLNSDKNAKLRLWNRLKSIEL